MSDGHSSSQLQTKYMYKTSNNLKNYQLPMYLVLPVRYNILLESLNMTITMY